MKKLHTLLLGLSLIFSSCALFENDVADFMEKYTETAAIEQHTFSIETYTDAANQLCIPSDQDVEITFYMRNPKQFNLIPSVNFENLDGQISRSAVGIEQTEFAIINLTLPQDFLIPADEGKDITPLINLYEPMSGRDFDRYSVSLSCNSKPPAILNPTILNKGNQTFVVAFDMPNEEEVAIRHKDLASVEINGVSYPVQVTTETDSTSDPEHPNLQVARYTFTDAHFKRSYSSSYITLKGKAFEHKTNNSVYFETDDAFTNGDKEYAIILRDSAGLTSEVKASTSISKLVKPEILDRDGAPIAEGLLAAAPYDEDTEKGVITIIPPTEDHLGNPVSGTTVYYKVYEATGSGRIYTSGTTTTAKTIELPQNTYRVEAYATLTNYENSATNTVKFRFMNSVIYVEAVTSLSDSNASNLTTGDGSIAAPFPTIADVIEDINRNRTGNDRKPKYTIYIKGDFTSPTYGMQDPAASHDYGSIVLDNIETDELIFKKWQGASEAKLKSINIAGTSTLQKVTIGDVTITNNDNTINNGAGILKDEDCEITLIIDGANIIDCSGYGIDANDEGTVTVKSGTISSNSMGISGEDCDLNIQGGTISNNANGAIVYGGSDVTCRISGGTITQNGSNNEPAVYIDAGICYITGGSIISNYHKGVHVGQGSTLYLYGGSITGNENGGIYVARNNYIHVKNNPVVQSNTISSAKSNITLESGSHLASPAIPEVTITIDGPLTAGARIGVTTATEPATIGQTYSFATGYVNSGSPSQYFTSDHGFSIVAGTGGAVNIAKSGSSGGMGNAFDYAMTFAFEKENGTAITRFLTNEVTPLYIKPTITRNGSAVTYASLKNDISWTIKLYNGASFVTNLSVAENGSERVKVNLPASPDGNYEVKVEAKLLSLPHSGSCSLICYSVTPLTGGVNVPGDSWTSSTTLAEGETDKESQVFIAHRGLTIRNFWVSDHETTQAEYENVMGTNPSSFSSSPDTGEVQKNRPVENVSWYDALVYCNKRSMAEGLTPCYTMKKASDTTVDSTNPDDWGTVPTSNDTRWNAVTCNFNANGYRLPTEAEWEYCARSGNLTGEQFTYSGTSDSLGNYAWYSGTTNVNSKTHEVCKKQPNALGLYDISGNVYEWCWDWGGNTIDLMTGETGAPDGTLRTTRGGNYTNNADCCRVNFRDNLSPFNKGHWLGFRVVRNAN